MLGHLESYSQDLTLFILPDNVWQLHNSTIILLYNTIMAFSNKSSLTITHIGTATAIIDVDGVNLLTDPFFSPANTEWDIGVTVLKNTDTPAMSLETLPPIDAILLSHEDHPDNLDELGRRLLDGRKVLTTIDGAKKLAPRPGVRGLQPWETVTLVAGGRTFRVTATPCQHLPGGECTGFILEYDGFGTSSDGRPNALYISGDTVYVEELAETIPKKWNITVAIMNFGNAQVPMPGGGSLQVTMDGKQGARLFRDLKADVLVPMHFESWGHFTQFGNELRRDFQDDGVNDKVCWLTPGEPKKIF
ncbi:Zn-dependent hydrolases of the beta-lactamase fold, putative [Talaromyces stipitatus ATCC 10500]|uniref:Zn-dependent hydrolases of the beta-lactamase fold, putative n=1 Tax=Talaromyces stipitatus (strain ATCC 10500 / CBS 375.48 / QM 6759 / NRRL 1006) TaxID=441959 RepID=B8M1Y1_TALSN|nr:Zn-dependent hydrolases of the beta-lactamase fold, putative [Talaromyces stipitatus ATCC 10500]EED21359.1 Zn-dependent hydrolases of the beta-lactamase fold, putative [Talaromyces stipitatus ATCC 10500]